MFSSQVVRCQRWGVATSQTSIYSHSKKQYQHDVNFDGQTATWIHIIGSDILLVYRSDENFGCFYWLTLETIPRVFLVDVMLISVPTIYRNPTNKGLQFSLISSLKLKDIKDQEERPWALSVSYLKSRGRVNHRSNTDCSDTNQRTMWDTR